ncbi:amidohydrolase family protein [Sphingomonas histidinilytica]|jgi:imidazolonepropionase-like amidohydrolase|uniref:Imidazolonepropionase n=1 Tax=Rhizorhabdus histidinilytica TaxID=439228 RepID=A0A1T5CXJ3_9SPHN|nr:amidohydrolase family protein [Rhizorhabdus histidinilytica]MBO9376298.1 amidohydrolase family protein [Rhizorhabdus histidinilytica]QEH79106.1 amidohydrolase family protein [Sphingomonas sp. C8-2]SKB64056.1 Imidazolonepropionase [Rhizorhabdus histidinilytica]
MSRTLLRNVHIFDGVHPELIENASILIDGERIVSIHGLDDLPPADEIVDMEGRHVIPGLIDAHFHAYASDIDFVKLETLPPTYLSQRARHLMEDALKRGFTTVRDVGGGDYGLWRAIEEGWVVGPRLFYCGHAFSQSGGHGDIRAPHEAEELCGCSGRGILARRVDGVDAMRKAAREALRQGAHHLKIFVSGGIASPSDPIWMLQFSEEEIAAIVDEASRRRSYVAAHAYTAETIVRAVRLGVRTIEHGNLIDAAAAQAVAEAGAFVVPTLATYEAFRRSGVEAGAPDHLLTKLVEVADKGIEAIRLCRAAGAKLGFGTDLLGPLHRHQRDEFRLRAQAETPFEILQSATSVNASILGMDGHLGTIAPGAFADLLAIDGNPLTDISLLYEDSDAISSIWKGGCSVGAEPYRE